MVLVLETTSERGRDRYKRTGDQRTIPRKGRSHAKVCIEDQLITVELQKRDRVEQNAAFADIARYDLIEFSNVAKIGDRHRLTEDSVCSRIDEADRLLSQLSKADS